MDQLQELFTSYAWFMNGGALLLLVVEKFTSNTKFSWALTGVILLCIAIGNAAILVPFNTNTSSQLAALFGTIVHGALGATFIANWLTDGAR